jgi:hypothetical protein
VELFQAPEAAALDLPAVKRRKISEREEAEALEKAELHRNDLLADLQAREAARREALRPSAPEEPAASPEPAAEPPADAHDEPEIPKETAAS